MAFSFGCGPTFGDINQSFEQSAADALPRFSKQAGDNRDMAGAGDAPAPFSSQAPSFLPATTGFQIGQPSPFGQQQAQAQPVFGPSFGVAAGNKVTTPANSACNPFGGPAGARAMPFANNSFMPQATHAANLFAQPAQSFQQLDADAKLAQSVAAAATSPHSPNLVCSNLLKPESAIVILNAVISSGLHPSSHTPSDNSITDA
jgi:hypothetical protein